MNQFLRSGDGGGAVVASCGGHQIPLIMARLQLPAAAWRTAGVSHRVQAAVPAASAGSTIHPTLARSLNFVVFWYI